MNNPSDQSVNSWIDRGVEHHQSQQLAEAAKCYDHALSLDAYHPEALHLRGVIAHQLGEHAAALILIGQAIEQEPDDAEYHHSLGEILRQQMRYADALTSSNRALAIEPDRIATLRSVGLASHLSGKFAEALDAWDRAIALEPTHAESHNNRGMALAQLNRGEQAIEAYQAAIAHDPTLLVAGENLYFTLNSLGRHDEAIHLATAIAKELPDNSQATINLAGALVDAGRFDQAISALFALLKKEPDNALAHLTMGLALHAMREWTGAESAFRRAIELNPQFHIAYVQLSYLLTLRGEPKKAIVATQQGLDLFPRSFPLLLNQGNALAQAHFMEEAALVAQKAVDLRPYSPMALNLLGTVMSRLSRYEAAKVAFEQALEVNPGNIAVLGNYATMLALHGDLKTSIETFRRSAGQSPQHTDLHSNMLLYLNGLPDVSPQEIFEQHVSWGKSHGIGFKSTDIQFEVTRDRNRVLRVGYVSGDWRHHSVAYFITPLLEAHNRANVFPVVYDNVAQPDSMTKFQRSLVEEWHRIYGLSDDELAAKIRKDQIDVLVDLSGHTGNHRLRTFARRAAPIQVNYLGYPNTTGLPDMDYRLTDSIADPPELSDAYHTEKLVRLESPFLCYRPSEDAPAVVDLPALTRGYVTFCSFNAISKFNQRVVEVWSEVLKRLPDARLLIKAAGMQEHSTQQRVLEGFLNCGIDTSRLELLPRAPSHNSHMATYGDCDIALDTFPYNGTTTTCEAFWMGVPVITTYGTTHASRVTATLAKSIGLDDFVSMDDSEFVAIALRYANDLPRLAEIRKSMRERMSRSALMDAPRKAASIEAAYREMWDAWLTKSASL